MSLIDERTTQDFLYYANSVIKSRAIPRTEDNLKPIHRKILYTLYITKLTSDKEARKSMATVGEVLKLSPHGDAAAYEALTRLAQWWKLRYPLVEMQGNTGNILGDGAAAARYTNAKLSKIGDLMLADIDKDCVDFRPNYDESMLEPQTLPSKFPFLLCGNNSGIAVGMSSDLVSHNFGEVADAINYYLDHKDCTISDLMQFIKGPDFPTGGQIINGEDLYGIYTTGRGSLKMRAHYDVVKKNSKTQLIFHDLPYGVEIDSGVKAPLKKLVVDDGYEVFEDIEVKKVGPRNFDITITLGKNANVAECLNLLFTKTKLQNTIKINQTVIQDGEPKLLNLKQMVEYWTNYRSGIIKRVAQNNYDKTSHKLTVVIGLQKCMSDIDLLISLIRNSDSRAAALQAIMKAFELTEEQGNAVLDMKLSRLSKLDLRELNDSESDLEKQIARLSKLIADEKERDAVIKADLKEIGAILKDDCRLTEIIYSKPAEQEEANAPAMKKEYLVYTDGVIAANEQVTINGAKDIRNNLVASVIGYGNIITYNAQGELCPDGGIIGGFEPTPQTKWIVAVTKGGNIKKTSVDEYKFKRNEKSIKLKDDDEVVFIGPATDDTSIIVYAGQDHLLRLAVKDLPAATRQTLGVKTGFTDIINAFAANDGDVVVTRTKDNKMKFTPVKEFGIDSRGNKGQLLHENTVEIKFFDSGRDDVYVILKQGKPLVINKSKLSTKSRTASGASVTVKIVEKIV